MLIVEIVNAVVIALFVCIAYGIITFTFAFVVGCGMSLLNYIIKKIKGMTNEKDYRGIE